MRVGLCSLSPTFRLELIQPLDERSPYAGSLARHERRRPRPSPRLDVADYDTPANGSSGSATRSCSTRASTARRDASRRCRATYFDTDGRARVHARDRRRAGRVRDARAGARGVVPDTAGGPTVSRDSRDPTPDRARVVTRPGAGAPLPRAEPRARSSCSSRRAADPDRSRRRHVVPAAVPRAARAGQGLPGLGRRRQRVPRPAHRRLGDDPRPRATSAIREAVVAPARARRRSSGRPSGT